MDLPERITPVRTYKVNAYCPKCSLIPNPGCILRHTGEMFMTLEPCHIYKCENCDQTFESKKVYPRLEVEYEIY